MTYHAPAMFKQAFTCPHCNAYANMHWSHIGFRAIAGPGRPSLFLEAQCAHCNKRSYWFNEACKELMGKMCYPAVSNVPMPHQDMPDEVANDYLEARAVLPYSVKASAALLRLALQKLCIHFGKNKNINLAIGELVAEGLPKEVQMAFDAIRIIGNESVHPGEIKDEDLDIGVAQAFDLMNFIVQDRITRFQQARSLYESLPDGKLEGVRVRDKGIAIDGGDVESGA